MKDQEYFSLVLDKDEQILRTYRPNRARAWFTTILASIFVFLVIGVTSIGCLLDGETAVGIVTLVFAAIIIGLLCLFVALWCNKTIYAITNKRVLIRTGYIGVDYKSLDFTLLGALTVNVSWVDKLLRKNTGSLAFGSMASPLTTSAASKFNFLYIQNPYVTYKEIKSIIDESKSDKNIQTL